MQAPRDDLLPPKEDPFTQEALKAYDGSDPDKPVYVAIKGFYHTKFSPSLFPLLSEIARVRHRFRCIEEA